MVTTKVTNAITNDPLRFTLTSEQKKLAKHVIAGVFHVAGLGFVGDRGIPLTIKHVIFCWLDGSGTVTFESHDGRYSVRESGYYPVSVFGRRITLTRSFWKMLSKEERQLYVDAASKADFEICVRPLWLSIF